MIPTAQEIAKRLGLARFRRSWRGRCPACDYAGNIFRLWDGKNGQQAYCHNGCGRDVVDNAIQRIMGTEPQPRPLGAPSDSDAQRASNQLRALRLWAGSEPVPGTPGERYLGLRGLPGAAGSLALRFRADCPHPETSRLPALVAAVTDAGGAMVGLHRTFIRRDGSGKASVEPTRASIGPIWGGAVRLDPVTEHLVIGEGIETAASAGLLLCLPAWAATSAGNLARGLILPPEVRAVTIAADPDAAGRDAARAAWSRWTAEGRRVQVATPDGKGDFNDVLRARGVAHA
jgi:putative DNA primase/helicase